MTYEEYWRGPLWLVKSYREAYDLKRKNEEWARHRQGAYVMQALRVAMSGFSKDNVKEKYPADPWPLTEKEAQRIEAEKERAGYEKALAKRRAEVKAAQQKDA